MCSYFVGIVSRLNAVTDDKESSSEARLANLSTFQVSILRHALSFPAVKRVVYSTCSIHTEENEDVVARVLDEYNGTFSLVPVLPGIPSRGKSTFSGSQHCLRLSPTLDHTNGFFVSCFERQHSEGGTKPSLSLQQRNLNPLEQCQSSTSWSETVEGLVENTGLNDEEIRATDIVVKVPEGKTKNKKKKKKKKNIQDRKDSTADVQDVSRGKLSGDGGEKRKGSDDISEVSKKKPKTVTQCSSSVGKKKKKQKKKPKKPVTA